MSGSRYTYLTPSGLRESLHSGEHDSGLPSGISTSVQHSSSNFSVYTAVLQSLQRSAGIEPTTHPTVGQESLASRIRDTNRLVVSESPSLEERLSKLVTTSALALHSCSIGRWNQGDSDNQRCFAEEMVVNRKSNRRKKQFVNSRFYKLNKKLNELKISKENNKKNLVKLEKKYKEAKKIIEKHPSQTLTNNKKLKTIIAKLKKEEKVVQKSIANLDKKYKGAKKLLNETPLSDSRKSKVKKFLKSTRYLKKINTKNHVKLKNHKTIKALLRKSANQKILAKKKSHKIFICAPTSTALSNNNLHNLSTDKKSVLRGGGGDVSKYLARGGLAIQSNLSTGEALHDRINSPYPALGRSTGVGSSTPRHFNLARLSTNSYHRDDILVASGVNPTIYPSSHPKADRHTRAYRGYTNRNNQSFQNTAASKSHLLGPTTTSQKTIQPTNERTRRSSVKTLQSHGIRHSRRKRDHRLQGDIHSQNKLIQQLLIDRGYLEPLPNKEFEPPVIVEAAVRFMKTSHANKQVILKKFRELSTGCPEIKKVAVHNFHDWISINILGKNIGKFLLQQESLIREGIKSNINKHILDILEKIPSQLLTEDYKLQIQQMLSSYISEEAFKQNIIINECKLLPHEVDAVRREVHSVDTGGSSTVVEKIEALGEKPNGGGTLYTRFRIDRGSSRNKLYDFFVYDDFTYIPVKHSCATALYQHRTDTIPVKEEFRYVIYNKNGNHLEKSYPVKFTEDGILILTDNLIDTNDNYLTASSLSTDIKTTTKPTGVVSSASLAGSVISNSRSEKYFNTTRTTTDNPTQLFLTTEKVNILVSNSDIFDNIVSPSKRAVLNQQNSAVSGLLVNHNKLIIEKIHESHSALMFHAAVVNFVKEAPANLEIVVRVLQNVSGHYGAEPDEIISEATQKVIFYDWLVHNVLGEGLSNFIVREAVKNYRLQTKEFVNHINIKIKNYFYNAGLHDDTLINVFKNLFPVGIYQNAEWNDIELVYINAGLSLASDIGIDFQTLTKEEASELGQAIYIGLQQGVVPGAWVKYFKLFAVIQYAKDNRSEVETLLKSVMNKTYAIEEKAISNFFNKLNQYNLDHNPFYKFNTLLNNYKTRTQLSDAIREKKCPQKNRIDHLNGNNLCVTKSDHPAGTLFLKPPENGFTIEDATKVFNKQNNEIANDFSIIDSLLITNAWDAFTESEKEFIFTAKIQRANAHFSALDTVRDHQVAGNQHLQTNLRVSLSPNVDLFSATRGTEERIYALQTDNGKYAFQRVDRDVDYYYSLLPKSDNRPFFDKDFKLVVIPQANEIKKLRNTHIEALIETLVSEHQGAFTKELYDQGYDKTGLEKFEDFVLSVVPFYTCITEWRAGNDREAIQACMLDGLSFVPFAGRAAGLAIGVAQRVGVGGRIAVRHMLAQSALKAALKKGGSIFIHAAVMPASEVIISPKNLASLGIQALRSLDPVFELVSIVGKSAVKQFVKLGGSMVDSLPKLKGVLSKFEKRANRLLEGVTADRYARLPGSEIEVPLKKISRKYNNQDVYVRVNPDTGEAFGQLYTCPNKKLKRGLESLFLSCLPVADRAQDALELPSRNTGAIPKNPKITKVGETYSFSEGLSLELSKHMSSGIPESKIADKLIPDSNNLKIFKHSSNGELYLKYQEVFFPIENSFHTLNQHQKIGYFIYNYNEGKNFLKGKKIVEAFYDGNSDSGTLLTKLEDTIKTYDSSKEFAELLIFSEENYVELLPNEKSVLAQYTKMGNHDINDFLRNGDEALKQLAPTLTAKIREDATIIKTVVEKLPVYPGKVYRSQWLPQARFEGLTEGELVFNKGLWSTSIDEKSANLFSEEHYQAGFKNIKLIIEVKKTAHPIVKYSRRPNEGELLIQCNACFRVIEKTPTGVIRLAELENQHGVEANACTQL